MIGSMATAQEIGLSNRVTPHHMNFLALTKIDLFGQRDYEVEGGPNHADVNPLFNIPYKGPQI